MSAVSPVAMFSKEAETLDATALDMPTGAPPKVGSRIREYLRLDRFLERTEDWALYLGDDEESSQLVLVVIATSEEALTRCLSGPAKGVVLKRTTLASLFVAEIMLEEHHYLRFGERFLSVRSIPTESPTLVSPSSPHEACLSDGSIFAGRYRIDGVLGRGGMGEVYRAFDDTFQRAVALKVVRVDMSDETTDHRDESKRRLLNEARLVSVLKHPHIVEVYDAGESSGLAYLVLELCDGGSLRKAMSEGASEADRLRWIIEIAEALAHAHDQGIIHRDVKPENVILTRDGVAKVADFGIAKALARDRAGNSTGIVGTPRYMAPEQILGGAVDARADQYAWGLVAYELLSGSHWRSRDAGPLRDGHLVTGDPAVPPSFRRVLARVLSNDPRARYDDVRTLLGEWRHPTGRRRAWPRTLAIIAASMALVAGAFTLTRQSAGQSGARKVALASPSADEPAKHAGEGLPSSFARPEDSMQPEARAAYDAAVQLWVDASSQDALASLAMATQLDTSFARAHLLYALIDDVTADARQHWQLAAQHRSKLSSRDRDLLDALGPSLHDPVDLEETRTLLERLEKRFPEDPDIPLFIASRYLRAWDGKRALPFADRAMEWPRPIARLMRARCLAKLNRVEDSRAEYGACFASSPSATGCLRWNAKLDAAEGRCQSVENLARQLIAAAPNNPDGYYFLAGGLVGQTASMPSAQAALETRWLVAPESGRTWLRLQDTFYLQVSSGAFDDAERTLDAWQAESLRFSDADHRGRPAVERLLLNLELGRTKKAASLARTYLEQSRAWTEGASIVFDIEAYRVLYWSHAIDRTEFDRLRAAWLLASEHRRAGMNEMALYRWYEGFVEPVATEEDAVLAVSRRPEGMEEPDRELMQTQSMQRLGRMYLLAGQTDQALVFLKRSVESCFYRYPFHQMWANLDYAAAVSQKGDTALALKSIDTILHRWGNDPRSKTQREARDLAARLRYRSPKESEHPHGRQPFDSPPRGR
ncbi:protein kinase domain-containing protein [Pendulispora albinea]|uniref:Serine/threonine protein kinase n=1 Tax=Pendulispora albinea TaxID=2741071 RepID=A0ABZ2M3H1_9BACT